MIGVLRVTSLLVAAMVIVLIVGFAFAVSSQTGSRMLIGMVLPDFVEIGDIRGRISGVLELNEVSITTPEVLLQINHAELAWNPAELPSGWLHIRHLWLDEVTVTQVRGTDDATKSGQPLVISDEYSLPLAIELADLTINALQYRPVDATAPIVLDKIMVSGFFEGTTLVIRKLDIASALVIANADAEVELADDFKIKATLDTHLRPEGYAEVHLITRISGDRNAVKITATAADPYNLLAEVMLVNPLQRLELDINATLDQVRLPNIQTNLPDVIVDLHARSSGNLEQLESNIDANVFYQGLEIKGVLATRLNSKELVLDTLDVSIPGQSAQLLGQGKIDLVDPPTAKISITWRDLQWPPVAQADYQSASGQLHLSGSQESYDLSTDAHLLLSGRTPLQLHLSGQGDLDGVKVETQLQVLGGTIEGDSTLTWSPLIVLDTVQKGKDLNPGELAAGWFGQLDLDLSATAELQQNGVVARIQGLNVRGLLSDQSVLLDASGAYEASKLTIDHFSASLGGTKFVASGRYADSVDMQWKLDIEHPEAFLEGLSGKILSTGKINGTIPGLKIDAQLDALDLAWQGASIESLAINADIDLSDRNQSNATVKIAGFKNDLLATAELTLNLDGTLADHQLQISGLTSEGDLQLDLEGGLVDPWSEQRIWQFGVTNATISLPQLAAWQLLSRAEGRINAKTAVIDNHCWTSDSAQMCFAATRATDRTLLAFTLSKLDFNYFSVFNPAAWQVEGALDGEGTLELRSQAPPLARVELKTSSGHIRFVDNQANDDAAESDVSLLPVLDFNPSTVTMLADDSGVKVSLALDFLQGGVTLDAQLDGTAAYMQRPLTGQLAVAIPNVGFTALFMPDISGLRGTVDGTLVLAGTLDQPDLSGRIALTNAAFNSPAVGLELTDISISLSGKGAEGIGIDGSLNSGGGNLTIQGVLWENNNPMAGTISVRGEDFHLVGTNEAQIYVSPDLRLTATPSDIQVSGSVVIPRAKISPESIPQSAVFSSRDVIELASDTVSADDSATPVEQTILGDVKFVFGDDVRFDGFGLKARFEGEALVRQKAGQVLSATGEIKIREGEYRAYGQGLVIENGRIFFAGGPVTQPGLDMDAVRRPQPGITVGAHVRGTLEQPEFTLFSEPSMSQQEQLSYLVLGRSLQDTSSGESSALAQAGLALGVKGSSFLAQNIGKHLGFDEFSIKSGSGEAGAASDPANAALVIGKYLSPKLYLSYGIGLFNPVSVLQMQYEISRNLKLITESSSESTGTDLVYRIDSGLKDVDQGEL